ALLRGLKTTMNQPEAAAAIAHAAPLSDPGMGNGRFDLVPALQSVSGASGSPGYSVSALPATQAIAAGGTANYTVSAAPANGFNQTITWSCTGAPAAATCTVTPPTVTLDGSSTATATVTLTTTPRSVARPLVSPRSGPRNDLPVALAVGIAWLAMALVFGTLNNASRRKRNLAVATAVLVVALYGHACGGYGSVMGPVSPMLSSVTISPSSVNGGSSSTGTVTLSGAAPAGGATVNLSSNSTSATVPSSAMVAAGATSATFSVNTNAVTASTPVTISASYAGVTTTASLTVSPLGTPAGTYTLTIIGTSGNLSHSTTVQVTVK